MIEAQAQRVVWVAEPSAAVNNGSATTAEVDTLVSGVKYDYATIFVRVGATDAPLTALKVQESDTSGAGFTDIPGAAITPLPLATDDNTTYAFYIELKGRKCILDLVATVGAGTNGAFITAVALLSRGKEAPDSAVKRGLTNQVIL